MVSHTGIRRGKMKFVPAGGLANRMMAVASAYMLQEEVDIELQILWFQDWGLHAPFHSIFAFPSSLSIKDATWSDLLLYDRARSRNLWIPVLPQKLLFERRIKDIEVDKLKRKDFDFYDWAKGHRCYMSCYSVFGNVPDEIYRQLFHPVAEVMQAVDENRSMFSQHTVGVHIRRTDHTWSITNSPDELFIKKVEEEIEAHADTKVYLATDSNQVKDTFRLRFGNRIMTPMEEANRDSISGIRGGLVDMYTLAATNIIYGSAGSTFSLMAAKLGGTGLEILSTANN